MNKKTIKSFLYQLRDDKKAIIIYYTIFLVVYAAILITTGLLTPAQEGSVTNGHGIPTAIFMFCACAFKENFFMLMQNGTSRKSVFLGRLLNSLTLAAGLAIVDTVLGTILSGIANAINGNLSFDTIVDMLYYSFDLSAILRILLTLLIFFMMFLAFSTLGYLMSTTFNRLNKTGKTIFAAGLPVTLFVVLPIVDGLVFKGELIVEFLNFLLNVLGVNAQQPIYAVATFAVIAVASSTLSWLLIRKARVE